MNRSVEGEIKERSLPEIEKKSSSLPTTFLTYSTNEAYWDLKPFTWRTQRKWYHPHWLLDCSESSIWNSGHSELSRKICGVLSRSRLRTYMKVVSGVVVNIVVKFHGHRRWLTGRCMGPCIAACSSASSLS